MKTLSFLLLLLTLASVQARLGETRKEITTRYGGGELSDCQRLRGAETMKYHFGNFQIEVVFSGDKSIWEIFKREDRLIDEEDIAILMEANRAPGTYWIYQRNANRWERTGSPQLIGYLWPQHEDFFTIKDPLACDNAALPNKSDTLKGF